MIKKWRLQNIVTLVSRSRKELCYRTITGKIYYILILIFICCKNNNGNKTDITEKDNLNRPYKNIQFYKEISYDRNGDFLMIINDTVIYYQIGERCKRLSKGFLNEIVYSNFQINDTIKFRSHIYILYKNLNYNVIQNHLIDSICVLNYFENKIKKLSVIGNKYCLEVNGKKTVGKYDGADIMAFNYLWSEIKNKPLNQKGIINRVSIKVFKNKHLEETHLEYESEDKFLESFTNLLIYPFN